MSHKAAFYTVRVKKKYKKNDYRALGEFDGEGSSLAEYLAECLNEPGFEVESDDKEKVVACASCALAEGPEIDEVTATLVHGRTGEEADIYNKQNKLAHHQVIDDIHQIKCGCVFWLPRKEKVGWLASHVHNGRNPKGLMMKGIIKRFREDFDGYALEIAPFVERTAIIAALEEGHLDKVKLVRLERPAKRSTADLNRWVPGGVEAMIELQIKPRSRHHYLKARGVAKYLKGDRSGYGDIVEFQGIRFDEAKIEVELPSGQKRTVNIESPDAGHAFTVDLLLSQRMGFDQAVIAALKEALADVA